MKLIALAAALALLGAPALAAPPKPATPPASTDPKDAKIAGLEADLHRLSLVLEAVKTQRDEATSRLLDQLALDASAAQVARDAASAAIARDAAAQPQPVRPKP